MCGILGWVDSEPVDLPAFRRGLATLSRRGPDGEGVWVGRDGRAVLGHRRLAILDLSERGAQPLVSADESSVFVHNGEIYNFEEIRRDLERAGESIRSTGDAEPAHRLLQREGPAGLHRMEGMFALARWDVAARRLLLARDRIGIKPLYYGIFPGGFAFASEPKALLALPRFSARLDRRALGDFLAYGYVPHDRCLFGGLQKLPPAHLLIYDAANREIRVEQYWDVERRSGPDDADELRRRLGEAVHSHMVSHVPVGAFLSGGLDSTAVVSRATTPSGSPMSTFAVAYAGGGMEDIKYARIAAEKLKTSHQEEILHLGDLETTMSRAAATFDEPIYDARSLAMLELSKLARRSVKVVLTGDGGDEIFGGYGWHESALKYERLRRRIPLGPLFLTAAHRLLIRPLGSARLTCRVLAASRVTADSFTDRYFAIRGFFGGSEQRRITGTAPEDPAWLFRHFDRPGLPLVHRLLYLDLHTYLPDNGLTLVDRSTMALGLEARVPLLDRQLVEYAFSLPPERLVQPGSTKIAFREAIAPWLPAEILTRPKYGFSPPFKSWVQGPRQEAALSLLARGDLAADGILDVAEVRSLVRRGSPRRNGKLWLLLNLEAWYRRWIRGRETR